MENKTNSNGNTGTMIGAIIVVIILLVGAFYFYKQSMQRQKDFQALIESAKQTASISDSTTTVTLEATSTNKK